MPLPFLFVIYDRLSCMYLSFSETHFHVCFHCLFSCFVFIILSSWISWKTESLKRNAILVSES